MKTKQGLEEIDHIMIAEKKRRVESNKIINEFIDEYLKNLHESIKSKIDSDF